MATKKNPLDSFAGSSSVNNLKLPDFPDLHDHVTGMGFAAGMKEWTRKMNEWKADLERAVNERLQPKAPKTSATP